jgi:3-hydroxyacyl-[acyl-carrier-protein] dehydratase
MLGESTLVIAPDHPAFAGHFPGTPIVPGVVLLDAAVHAVMQSLRSSASSDGMTTTCQISSAKFLSPVGPGETLTISYAMSASGSTRFDISSSSRKVAAGVMVLSSAS